MTRVLAVAITGIILYRLHSWQMLYGKYFQDVFCRGVHFRESGCTVVLD
jgi:hypothetical protein